MPRSATLKTSFRIACLSALLSVSAIALYADTYHLVSPTAGGVSPSGESLQTASTANSGFNPTKLLTGSSSYWYGPTLTGSYAAGNWSLLLWTDAPGCAANVTAVIGYTDSAGAGFVSLGSQTVDVNSTGGGIHTSSFTFAVPFENLVSRRLRVSLVLASGCSPTLAYNAGVDFDSRLISTAFGPSGTPTLTPSFSPSPTVTPTLQPALLKSVSNASPLLGDTITFTLAYKNPNPNSNSQCNDDFEAGTLWPSGWAAPTGGTWGLAGDNGPTAGGGGALDVAATGGYNFSILNCATDVTDGSIATDMKTMLAGGKVTLLWRQNGSSTYQFHVEEGSSGNVSLRVITNGAFQELAVTNYPISVNTWYKLRFVVSGFSLQGYIDGALVLSATDPNVTYNSGGAGLEVDDPSASGSHIRFDNVVIDRNSMTWYIVNLVDTLPAGLGYVSSTGGGTAAGQVVSFPLGTLTAQAAGTRQIVAVVNVCGSPQVNTGELSVGLPAQNFTSNAVTVTASCATATPTSTPTRSDTKTATPSSTPTFSHTRTATSTATPSVTPSSTLTATSTSTSSVTATRTGTATPSRTATSTASGTPSSTSSATPSPTVSRSSTATPTSSSTLTPSFTPTSSVTATQSSTRTVTPTATASRSVTESSTSTPTRTDTPIATATPTSTVTLSSTPTPTFSATLTGTGTFSETATPSHTMTRTATPTYSASVTASFTPTITPSSTTTPTDPATPSNTTTPSDTLTVTSTSTSTQSPTITLSPTASPTPLPYPFHVSATLYNSAGEIVRHLYDGAYSASGVGICLQSGSMQAGQPGNYLVLDGQLTDGSTQLPLDGRNDQGQPLGGGSYVVKWESHDPFGSVQALQMSLIVLPADPIGQLGVYNSAGELVSILPLPANLVDLSDFVLAGPAVYVTGQKISVNLRDSQGHQGLAIWDGRNNAGLAVGSGVYTLRGMGGADQGQGKAWSIQVIQAPGVLPDPILAPNPVPLSAQELVVYVLAQPALSASVRLYNLAGELSGQSYETTPGRLRLPLRSLSGGVYVAHVEQVDGLGQVHRWNLKVALLR